MVGNVIVQCELSLISIFQFLRPQKSLFMAAILNFSKTLKKSLAHLQGKKFVIFIHSPAGLVELKIH